MSEAVRFWDEVRRRRNLFFLAAPSAFVLAPIFFTIDLPRFISPAFAMVGTWMGLMWWMQKRVIDMKCFNCGQRALDQSLFFMRHAKCKHCETAYVDA